jgi:catechol 2,3-dioxygenase-like lactoylglutathione lyase family enzyme
VPVVPGGPVASPNPAGGIASQLRVDDLHAALDDLEQAGVTFRGELVEGRGGNQILVEDPSGNPVELFEPARTGQGSLP